MVEQERYAYVDTETTGLVPPWLPGGRVPWEVAVITDVGEWTWQFQLTDREIRDADQEALRIGGWEARSRQVTGQMGPGVVYVGANAQDRNLAMRDVYAALGGRVVVGVNPPFDVDTLHYFFHRFPYVQVPPVEPPWHYHVVDVTMVGAALLGLPFTSRSVDVSLGLGVNRDWFTPAHTALADARWAREQHLAILDFYRHVDVLGLGPWRAARVARAGGPAPAGVQ